LHFRPGELNGACLRISYAGSFSAAEKNIKNRHDLCHLLFSGAGRRARIAGSVGAAVSDIALGEAEV